VPKSIHRREYQLLAELLREARERAGLTQAELATRLSRSQSFVSDIELCRRRIDLTQLNDICDEIGLSIVTLVTQWQRLLHKQ
jgi:transcriptional regulator with XRE-family HTH domain